MKTAELQRLQDDHATIRAKLQQLKSALNGGSSCLSSDGASRQQDARQLCAALARQLRAHIQQEGRLATRCSMTLGRLGPQELARLAIEHHVDEESLRVINPSLAREGHGWVSHVGPLLVNLIARLKRQMEAQEADLFPFMERVLASNGHTNGHSNGNGREHS